MNTISHLPKGWELKKMPEVVKWGSGGTPKATEDRYYENGTIPWLIIGDLNDGVVKTSATKITKLGLENSSAKLIPCGTLLIAMYGSIGKLGITGFECCTNQAIAFAQKLNGVDTMYLFYYLMMIKPKLVQMGKGGTQKNISQTVLNSLYIPLPPLPTQQAIVTRIEALFAELDKAVQHLHTAQKQLKTYRQAVLNHWLNNDDRKWEMVNISCFLDNSCRGMMTGPFGTALKKSEHKSCGVPVLGIENIGEGSFVMPNKIFVTKEKAEELKTFAVKTDDIIISRSGTVGEICKVPLFMKDALLSTNLIRIRLNLDLINADYFVLLFQSSQIKQQVKDLCKGTTRAFLNQTILNQISFPLPPLPDQHRIVQEIESRLSQAEAAEASIAEALQKTEALRQSILKKAFSGELV